MTPLPATGGTTVGLRRATADDVPVLVALLTDDPFGRDRESPDLAPYRRAFAAVDVDPAQLLLALTQGPEVVGTAQLTEIPGLSPGRDDAAAGRGGAGAGRPARAGRRRRAAHLGRRGGPPARLRAGPADHRHPTRGGAPLLRAARVHRLARRVQLQL